MRLFRSQALIQTNPPIKKHHHSESDGVFFGPSDWICSERRERNSEMSVLAQANERHKRKAGSMPKACVYNTQKTVIKEKAG